MLAAIIVSYIGRSYVIPATAAAMLYRRSTHWSGLDELYILGSKLYSYVYRF